MGRSVLNPLKDKDDYTVVGFAQNENVVIPEISGGKATIEQDICEHVDQSVQEVEEKLLRIFEDTNFPLEPEKYSFIQAQMRIVVPKKIHSKEWERIRYLCVIDSDPLPSGWYLSHNGSYLLISNSLVDLNAILEQVGRNLIFLRFERELTAPLNLLYMKQLRYLRIGKEEYGRSREVMQVSGLERMSDLETLALMGTFDFSILDVSNMKNLRSIMIQSNKYLEKVTGLASLHELKSLVFWEVDKVKELDFSGLHNLEDLRLGYLTDLQRIPTLNQFLGLKFLFLCHLSFLQSVDLTGMKMLETLLMHECSSLQHIGGLEALDHLTEFGIDHTSIRKIPDALRGKPLKRLALSGLELETLADWLPELGLSFSRKFFHGDICLHGTTVKDVDMSIFDQSQEMILQWFEERRKKNNLVQLNEIKVVFLGDGEAGKSQTIARLRCSGGKPFEYVDVRTPGIVIKDVSFPVGEQTATLHLWDFGGQEILHSMHRIFLTERTFYVVIVDGRIGNQDERARYWLQNIQSFAKDAPVILVLNKLDDGLQADVNEEDLKHKYAGLKRIVKLSALKYTQEEFDEHFTNVLLEEIRETDFLNVSWPASWARVKKELEQMRNHYIRGERYEEICEECNVNQGREGLLHWFNDLGVSFCCCDDAQLKDYVILKPDWITNALYIILFNERENSRGGLIPIRTIRTMLGPDAPNRDQIERVLPGVYYRGFDVDYVLDVLRRFQLSFKNGDHEFIPMLSDRNAKPVAREYSMDPDTLEFRMEFDYLPNNVLHRLMVDRQTELDMDNVWLTGARFIQPETGLSAVVVVDEKILNIYVRHTNDMHQPNTYLAMLKANVDRIWQKMGLNEPENQLVYKLNGKQDVFDYGELNGMLEIGQKFAYSKTRKQMLDIRNILNQVAPAASEAHEDLRSAIILACRHLQGNRNYWNWNEDDRNTVVRNTLRDKGYIIHDQTREGLSESGIGSGELDMDIRRLPAEPWTICEALIVEGYAKKWNEHLDKLLNNYNPYGLPVLYLLTYVDCGQEKFGKIWEKYQKHIREDQPANFECVPESIETDLFSDYESTKVARCQYKQGSYMPTVYHIFVRIG